MVTLPAVGEDRRARLNVLSQTRPTHQPAAACDGQALSAPGPPPPQHLLAPGDLPAPASPPVGLIHLHHAGSRSAPAPTAADAAWPTRSGRKRPLQAQRRDPVFAPGIEPYRERRAVRSKIVPAVTELRPPHPEHLKPIAQPPATIVAAVRASEASGPSVPVRPGRGPEMIDPAGSSAALAAITFREPLWPPTG